MTKKQPSPPRGFSRFLFRLPIQLYRLNLGWLLGRRFILINHIGRKSGLPRQTVLEVAHYEPEKNSYYVAAGFGRNSDWFRNLEKTSNASIQVGRKKWEATAVFLTPVESGQMMVTYAQNYPKSAKNIFRFIGHETDGSEASFRQAGEQHIPFVAFKTTNQSSTRIK